MSLNKAIRSGKEKRKPYRGSKAFDYSCHNHKSCSYCLSNRTIQEQRAKLSAKERAIREESCEDLREVPSVESRTTAAE
jgi:hypothetical protein